MPKSIVAIFITGSKHASRLCTAIGRQACRRDLPQAVTRKRISSKGKSFFCSIFRKSQDHNHPHFNWGYCPSVMLKKKMTMPPFSFWHHTTDTHVNVVWMIGKFRKVACHICNETAVALFLNLQGSATPFEPTARVSLFAIWSTQTE